MDTIESKIKKHFEDGYSLTVVEALRYFNTIELRKFVSNLRRKGLDIKDEWVENSTSRKKFKRYFLPISKNATELNATNNSKIIFHNDEL